MNAIDARRALRAGLLAVWALFFAWLWVTGERARYLGPRTYWVIPFGVVFLGGAALVHVLTLRADEARRISLRDAAVTAVLLVPIAAVFIVPSPDLGALAASRKATSVGLAGSGSPTIEGAEVVANPSFIDVHHANQSAGYGRVIGVTEGTEVDLVGFVTYELEDFQQTDASFGLTRFYVSCCAADAIPYTVAIAGPVGSHNPPENKWLEVKGELVEQGGRLVLAAGPGDIRPVPEPDDPYLY